jgi:hypothetical protein
MPRSSDNDRKCAREELEELEGFAGDQIDQVDQVNVDIVDRLKCISSCDEATKSRGREPRLGLDHI